MLHLCITRSGTVDRVRVCGLGDNSSLWHCCVCLVTWLHLQVTILWPDFITPLLFLVLHSCRVTVLCQRRQELKTFYIQVDCSPTIFFTLAFMPEVFCISSYLLPYFASYLQSHNDKMSYEPRPFFLASKSFDR